MPQVNYRLDYRQQQYRANIARFGEPETVDELAEFVIRVINHEIRPNRVVGFKWNLRYTDQVSNTHSAPLGCVTNFSGIPGLPISYPGFTGRVWIRYDGPVKNPKRIFGSDPFARTATHTGTGGYGSYNGPWTGIGHYRHHYRRVEDYPEIQFYSWDYRFFLQDWPAISRNIEQQRIIDTLKYSRGYFVMDHEYEWNDRATARADSDFIDRMIQNENIGQC